MAFKRVLIASITQNFHSRYARTGGESNDLGQPMTEKRLELILSFDQFDDFIRIPYPIQG